MNRLSYKLKGFTLLELLLVIVVIGILATLSLGPIMAAQKRGRDHQRKTHLNLIAEGIDVYYSIHRSLPPCGVNSGSLAQEWITDISQYIPSAGSTTRVPRDPKHPNTNYLYRYECGTNGKLFTLRATLENRKDPEANADGTYTVSR